MSVRLYVRLKTTINKIKQKKKQKETEKGRIDERNPL